MSRGRIVFACLCFITVGLLFFGSPQGFGNGASAAGHSPLKEAREDLEKKLAEVPGFAGIAHSEEDGVIVVFLEHERAKGNVPDSHRGFRVRKEVTGEFKALSTQVAESVAQSQVSLARTGTYRPLVGGISVGALAGKLYVYAGTLGIVSYDVSKNIVSNAHVLAMNPDNNGWLPLGTTILQPGTLDGGRTAANRVGALTKYIEIKFSKPRSPVANQADAAIASIDTGIGANSGEQLGVPNYTVSGTDTVSVGNSVRKSGRTTAVTTGTVSYTNASTWVNYGRGKNAYFTDQIVVSQTLSAPFIQGGDSGSVVDKGGKAVGLAFAGSDTMAIVCKASYVATGLGISFGP